MAEIEIVSKTFVFIDSFTEILYDLLAIFQLVYLYLQPARRKKKS